MYTKPETFMVNPSQGKLETGNGHYQKHLKDLDGLYADEAAFSSLKQSNGEDVVYDVTDQRPEAKQGDLIFGVTRMSPGKVGDEYFMTRGHIHAIGNRPEVYYGEAGHGVMLLESPEGEIKTLEISPRCIVYVPPLWIHRSINTGDTDLVMSFFYPSDSGQDYNVISRQGGMKVRVIDDGNGGWKTTPNTHYKERSSEEVERILATQDV